LSILPGLPNAVFDRGRSSSFFASLLGARPLVAVIGVALC
jgi:hypothetical protein